MTRDTLDELLDHSAPPSRPAERHDLDAMIAEARESASRTVRSHVLEAAGLSAAFTFGGVGIAAATGGLA
jgi:dsDNA-binding SOS-regulon protein